MIVEIVKASTVRIRCTTCNRPTPLEGFYGNGKGGHLRTCITCRRAQDEEQRRWRRGAPRRHRRYNARGEVWCNNCQRYRHALDFRRHPTRPHTFWSYCKACTRELDRLRWRGERRERNNTSRVIRQRRQHQREQRERREFVASSILTLRKRGLTKADICRLVDTSFTSLLAWERKERRVTPAIADRFTVVMLETAHLPRREDPEYRRREPHPEIEQLLARCLPRVRAIPVRDRWKRREAA